MDMFSGKKILNMPNNKIICGKQTTGNRIMFKITDPERMPVSAKING
jgi:hypothetical protein